MIRSRKLIKITSRLVFVGVGIFGVLFGFVSQPYWAPTDNTDSYDVAVVFGAAVWSQDQPSQVLYDRTKTAAELWHQDRIKNILVSGGKAPGEAAEAEVMRRVLLESGVPPANIFTDFRGGNTIKTLQNIRERDQSYLFISSPFHLARIGYLAWWLGFDEFSTQESEYFGGHYAEESFYLFRETVALGYYLLPWWRE